MKRIAHFLTAAILVAAAVSFAGAQDAAQPQSLGDYARTVRKDKKPASAKQFDNDNLPVADKLSVVGGAATGGDQQSAAGGEASAAATADGKPPEVKPGESSRRPAENLRCLEGPD